MDTITDQKSHLLGYPSDSNSDDSVDLPRNGTSEKKEQTPRRSRLEFLRVSILFHIFLIVGYTLVSGSVILYMKKIYSTGPNLVYSPARNSVKYESTHFALLKGNTNFTGPYSGLPNPELDQRWEALVENLNFRITDEEMGELGEVKDAVRLSDGGYLANLNVHHELHCLMRLRWNLYPEFYFPDATPEMLVRNREHSEHCIDLLRLSTMCQSDITLLPYQWINSERAPVLNFGRPHECVNFEAVNKWAGDRLVDISEPGYIRHPYLGVSFPNGPLEHTYTYPYNATNMD